MAIITGAGRGIGRQHALVFGRAGARLVVNDTGGDPHGDGHDPSVAAEVGVLWIDSSEAWLADVLF